MTRLQVFQQVKGSNLSSPTAGRIGKRRREHQNIHKYSINILLIMEIHNASLSQTKFKPKIIFIIGIHFNKSQIL